MIFSGEVQAPAGVPSWFLERYPLAMAGIVALYGYLLRLKFTLIISSGIAFVWTSFATFWGYVALRARVAGLDYLSVSLAFFGIAFVVSLTKSGMLRRWTGMIEQVHVNPRSGGELPVTIQPVDK